MNILVTGGSGQLGGAIIEAFADLGCITPQGFNSAADSICYCDLRDPVAVQAMMADLKPDLVIHTAAYRDPDYCELHPDDSDALNRLATQYLLDAAPGETRFIYCSSDYVFDGTQPPYKEEDPKTPISAYGRQKAASEEILLARESTLVLRFPVLLSRRSDGSGYTGYVAGLVDAVESGEPRSLDHTAQRFPTSIYDVAAAARHLFLDHRQGIFHLSSPVGGTVYEICQEIGRILGFPTDHLRPGDAPAKPPAPRPKDARLSTEKLSCAGFSCRESIYDFL